MPDRPKRQVPVRAEDHPFLTPSDVHDLTAAVRSLTAALREHESAYQRRLQHLGEPTIAEQLLGEVRAMGADLARLCAVLATRFGNGHAFATGDGA